MRTWLILIGGLLIWMIHFLGSYIIASLFPAAEIANWLVLALTAVGLAATALLVLGPGLRLLRSHDGSTQWMGGLAIGGSLLAAMAIAYQLLALLLA